MFADYDAFRRSHEDPFILAGCYIPKGIDLFARVNVSCQLGLAGRGDVSNILGSCEDDIIDKL